MDKRLTLILAIILVLPGFLLFNNTVDGQSSTDPPAPEFTVKFINASYNMTSTTNTGKTITQQIDNSTVELIIKPYNYTVNPSQYYIDPINAPPTFHLYYDIQAKKPSEQKWTDFYPLENKISNYATGAQSLYISDKNNLPASNNSEVKLTFRARTYPLGTGFQVKAIIGHEALAFIPDESYSPWGTNADNGRFVSAVIYVTSSNWSQTQTVSLPETVPTPTLSTTPAINEPDADNIYLIIIAIVFLGAIVLSLVLCIRRK